MQKGPKYTTIIHSVRRGLNLSFIEYAVIEGISHLSNQDKYPWCLTTREDLADFYGFTKKGIIKLIDRLVERGFLEKNEEGNLRASALWVEATTDTVNSVHQLGELSTPTLVNSVHRTKKDVPQVVGVLSTPNHNHKNNHNNNQSDLEENTESLLLGFSPPPVAEPPLPTVEDQAKELVEHFQKEFGRKGGGPKVTSKNLPYWLEEYSLEEIKQAITNASQDSWWKDKLTLEMLLRKRKPTVEGESQEYVDRIGKFLGQTQQKNTMSALEAQAVWDLAKEMNIPWKVVNQKSLDINKMIENGEIDKYARGRTSLECLRDWLQKDLNMGRLHHCNELEALDLEDMHPKKVEARKKLDEYKKRLIEEGVL